MPVITIQIFVPDEEIGCRVGAFVSYDGDDFEGTPTLKLLGYGIYEGVFRLFDEESADPITGGEAVVAEYREAGRPPTPRIKLDTGEYLWGSFFYWDEEDSVKAIEKKSNVVKVDVESFRQNVEKGLDQYEDWKSTEKQVNVWNKKLYDPIQDEDTEIIDFN